MLVGTDHLNFDFLVATALDLIRNTDKEYKVVLCIRIVYLVLIVMLPSETRVLRVGPNSKSVWLWTKITHNTIAASPNNNQTNYIFMSNFARLLIVLLIVVAAYFVHVLKGPSYRLVTNQIM
jgi:hypothetical protein